MGEPTYSGSGWVSYAGFDEDEAVSYSGESGLASFGLYDVHRHYRFVYGAG